LSGRYNYVENHLKGEGSKYEIVAPQFEAQEVHESADSNVTERQLPHLGSGKDAS